MKHEIRNATCRVGAKRRRESEARSKPGPAVAQICNLLCRRFSICCAWKGPEHAGESTALPTASRRYSAARRSRNQSSAELYSAVSPICNRLAARRNTPADPSEPSAEYNSAIQQITNLRYQRSSRRVTTWTDTDRLQISATQRRPFLRR